MRWIGMSGIDYESLYEYTNGITNFVRIYESVLINTNRPSYAFVKIRNHK